MKKTNLKVSLFLSFLCFIAGFFVFPYQMEILQNELPNQYKEIETMPFPFGVMLILIALQLFVISFILAFLGIKLARRTGFSLNLLDSIINKGKVILIKRRLCCQLLLECFWLCLS